MPQAGPSLARSLSADSVKATHVREGPGGQQWSISSPELRSMLVNLTTTVPHNISSPHLAITPSKKQLQHRHKRLAFKSCFQHCCCCSRKMKGRCMGGRLSLVILQILLGAGLTALAVYIHLCVTTLKDRDQPFYAGLPLLVSGLLGIFFCIRYQEETASSTLVFILKVSCTIFTSVSVVTCVTSCALSCIHLVRLFTFAFCENLANACRCYTSGGEGAKTFLYAPLVDCDMLFCKVKICILFSGSLSLLGSVAALSFLIVLWKSRYGHINARPTHGDKRRPSDS